MSIADNVKQVQENIEKACFRCGRDPKDVLLIGVTKYVDTDRILEAIHAGITDVGENHAQEVREKLSFFKQNGCKSHFIGHLQGNKIKYLCGEVDTIQSVDSLSLVQEISKKAEKLDITQKVFVQVNIGDEDQKSGISDAELVDFVGAAKDISHIRICGLMCVPPAMEAESVRPYFVRMRKLLETAQSNYPDSGIRELSMGMSHDYMVAVEEGATMVRVGSAIFGARDKK